MKTNRFFHLCALATAVSLLTSNANAVVINLDYGSHHSGVGGEFAVTARTNGTGAEKAESLAFVTATAANYSPLARVGSGNTIGFETFCIEYNEHFTPGANYNIGISESAKAGGGGAVNGYDKVSVGTAYLYCLFATGQLTGYDYTSNTSAGQLQNTFWFLEDEGIANPTTFDSLLITRFGSVTEAKGDTYGSLTARSFGVSALNMGPSPDYMNQDQLIYQPVPDGGATLALLGMAVGSLSLFIRKVA